MLEIVKKSGGYTTINFVLAKIFSIRIACIERLLTNSDHGK